MSDRDYLGFQKHVLGYCYFREFRGFVSSYAADRQLKHNLVSKTVDILGDAPVSSAVPHSYF